jgi:NOL1/NOP2/sun family putative RNA methylase
MINESPLPIDRYRGIIDDWPAFQEASARSLPPVLRTNTLRIDPHDLCERLNAQGIELTGFDWDPRFFCANRPLGLTVEHWLGLYYIQEAVQAIPVLALDPQPGEQVLDLCAAPGGKTTDIADRMRNRGCVIANEPNGRRQQALLSNLNRVGPWNVTVTEYNGQDFPLASPFDRVLVDAPCSAEGTLRKESALADGASSATVLRLTRLQKMLILRGFDLLKPGGVLVYSTCTFAPEENEAVVQHLLRERAAHIVPLRLPFPHAPGVTAWNGEEFEPQLAGCARVYPHHLNSGGGFVARIERLD